ncbi:MAG: hypothetical protein JXN64_15825 [Spirochaetes bacterium]|nr:hypothetical protein [Spirochaetota bacterium]
MIKTLIPAILLLLLFYSGCKSVETTQKQTDKGKTATVYGCVEGNCVNGSGIYTWENGSKYIGEFKNSSMHGQGTFYFSGSRQGAKYVGEFKNGFIDGFGTWTWPNGDKYIGDSKYNSMHGNGTYYFSDGTIKKGKWFNDKYFEE